MMGKDTEWSLSSEMNNYGRLINRILENAGHDISMETMARILVVIEAIKAATCANE